MDIKKNQEYVVEIIDNGYKGEGIAKIDGFTVFVEGAIKGEKVKILIVKVLSSHAFGKIIEILTKSEFRREIDCATYKRCGGCDLRHVKYEKTLDIKRNMVQNLVNKTLIKEIKVNNTIGMDNPICYRNKAQYPVGINKDGKPVIGVFAERTHEVVPIEKCLIQDSEAEQIAKFILQFIKDNNISVYNEEEKNGIFRHIVIKKGFKTNQIMCVLVINNRSIPKEKELVEKLIINFDNIKSIVKNVNMKNTNVILGQENINLYGNGYIEDILGEYKFKISPLSFYQVNPVQAEILYNFAIKLADISKKDIVFDLYCGVGTISIFMSKYASKIYGVEIIDQAIEMAKDNAKMNNIDNIEFIAGDSEIVLTDLIEKKNIKPDIIVVDPPRKGLDKNSVENILKAQPKKVIYISCNPASLVRDLNMLEDLYNIVTVQPFDLFPFTHHVEACVLLMLKS